MDLKTAALLLNCTTHYLLLVYVGKILTPLLAGASTAGRLLLVVLTFFCNARHTWVNGYII